MPIYIHGGRPHQDLQISFSIVFTVIIKCLLSKTRKRVCCLVSILKYSTQKRLTIAMAFNGCLKDMKNPIKDLQFLACVYNLGVGQGPAMYIYQKTYNNNSLCYVESICAFMFSFMVLFYWSKILAFPRA